MHPATLTRASHGNVHRLLAVVLAVLLLMSITAIAHNAPASAAENTNSVAFWCGSDDAGVKYEPVSTPFIVPEPSSGTVWSLLVIKAASGADENATWPYPIVGQGYTHPSGHANSHAILCWEPEATTTTTTQPTTTTTEATTTTLPTEVLGTAQLGDTVWLDANENGIQDNGEVGFNGARVDLKDGDGNVIATLTTETGAWIGFYKFLELDDGTYTAALDLSSVSGYAVTTANAFTISIVEGDDYLDADFGLFRAESTTTTTAPEELPKTGVDSGVLAAFAFGLLLLGSLAVFAARKPRVEEQ